MKIEKKVIMKRDWNIIKEILLSIENDRRFSTKEVSNNIHLIAYNHDLLLHKNYITSSGGELLKSGCTDDLVSVVDFIEEKSRLTFKGHELLDCLSCEDFIKVKKQLEKMGIQGTLKMVRRITEKVITQNLEEQLKLK